MTQERFAITGCRPRKFLGILLLLAMVGRAPSCAVAPGR